MRADIIGNFKRDDISIAQIGGDAQIHPDVAVLNVGVERLVCSTRYSECRADIRHVLSNEHSGIGRVLSDDLRI